MNKMKVTLLVFTLNEITGMREIMPRVQKEWYDELLIVDGGSSDGTIEYCKKNGFPIFIQSGRGLPNAYDEAFLKTTKDIIVLVTPDGNSLPELIPQLVEKIHSGYDLVIASRYLNQAKSYDDDMFTAFGNKMFTTVINILFGAHYTDVLVGYRALRRDAVLKMNLLGQHKQGWLKKRFVLMNTWEPSSSIRAAKLKLKIDEIAGDEPKRIGGERKLSIIRNGCGVLLQILHELILGKNFIKNSSGGNYDY